MNVQIQMFGDYSMSPFDRSSNSGSNYTDIVPSIEPIPLYTPRPHLYEVSLRDKVQQAEMGGAGLERIFMEFFKIDKTYVYGSAPFVISIRKQVRLPAIGCKLWNSSTVQFLGHICIPIKINNGNPYLVLEIKPVDFLENHDAFKGPPFYSSNEKLFIKMSTDTAHGTWYRPSVLDMNIDLYSGLISIDTCTYQITLERRAQYTNPENDLRLRMLLETLYVLKLFSYDIFAIKMFARSAIFSEVYFDEETNNEDGSVSTNRIIYISKVVNSLSNENLWPWIDCYLPSLNLDEKSNELVINFKQQLYEMNLMRYCKGSVWTGSLGKLGNYWTQFISGHILKMAQTVQRYLLSTLDHLFGPAYIYDKSCLSFNLFSETSIIDDTAPYTY